VGFSFHSTEDCRDQESTPPDRLIAAHHRRDESPPLEPAPQLNKKSLTLRRDRPSEVEEDLESGGTSLIEKLEAACRHAVHVTGLLHGEGAASCSHRMCISSVSVCTLKNSPAVLKPPNCPSTSIVDAPFDTSTRTEPNVSKL
jgi:hypothetical protein